jgi:lysophospholipase L1-like esterase
MRPDLDHRELLQMHDQEAVPVPPRRGSWLARSLAVVRAGWIAFGVTMLLFLAADSVAMLVWERKLTQPWRAEADAYGGAPWVVDYWREQKQTKERWVPYSYFETEPFQGRYINVGRDGLRRTWNRAEGKDDARVYMFGGSTIWGFGSRDEGTIPSALSRLLAEADLDVQVKNFGQNSHVSTQQVIVLLKALATGPAPDIVIFYSGANDVGSSLLTGFAGQSFAERDRAREFQILWRSRDLFSALLASSGFARLTRFIEPPRPFPAPPDPKRADELAREVVQRYAANVRLVEESGRIVGFRPIFYWQPTVQDKGYRSPYEQSLLERDKAVDFFKEVHRDLVAHETLAHNENFHDLTELFAEEHKPCYLDRVHLSEEANRKVASRMLVDVVPALRARQGKETKEALAR